MNFHCLCLLCVQVVTESLVQCHIWDTLHILIVSIALVYEKLNEW